VLESYTVSEPEERLSLNVTRATREVFAAALRLGLTSFGGPIAHLGYFEREYVHRLRWLRPEEYANLVALCQMLPGPTSSQVGFLIGLQRAGWRGALAAWTGFTLPSALLMYTLACALPSAPGARMQTVLHGLMLAAVVVVAQAVWSMARTNCGDWRRLSVALLALACVLLRPLAVTQVAALLGGALLGRLFLTGSRSTGLPARRAPAPRAAWLAALTAACLLIALPLLGAHDPHGPLALANIFYRAGALVFGGGHVVLPLLHEGLAPAHWVSDAQFLAGYGLAQAMPGPLFTFAAYLGALAAPTHTAASWALIALVAIFLPGLLLAAAGLSAWSRLVRARGFQGTAAGVNASVVGVLAAAFYNPVASTALVSTADVLIVLLAFAILTWRRSASLAVVGFCVLASLLVSVRIA
jgi:chromate transporter